MNIGISHIEYYLPEIEISNDAFQKLDVNPEFLEKQIGIKKRFITKEDESVTDMAYKACKKLEINNNFDLSKTECLIFCTETPDYRIPPCAPIMQDKLHMTETSMCFDINLGCSGFIYGIAIAKSLMETFNFSNCLLINSEAYSKIINKKDRTVVTLFSDAASVTILEKNCICSEIIDFNFGTDGRGFENLIIKAGGSKIKSTEETRKEKKITQGTYRSLENLYMNGFEISKFVLKEIPKSITQLLENNHLSCENIYKYFFHQANKYLLESLAKKMNLNLNNVYIDLSKGNTVSCSIPIALKDFFSLNKTVHNEGIILLSAFGVGYSWGNSILKINRNFGEQL